jgi:hypothetical protein
MVSPYNLIKYELLETQEITGRKNRTNRKIRLKLEKNKAEQIEEVRWHLIHIHTHTQTGYSRKKTYRRNTI